MQYTHTKVLLRKDFLTLWRNKGTCISLFLVPIILLAAYFNLQKQVIQDVGGGSLVESNFKYTTTQRMMYPGIGMYDAPFMTVPPLNTSNPR
jgi:hypothetical protein